VTVRSLKSSFSITQLKLQAVFAFRFAIQKNERKPCARGEWLLKVKKVKLGYIVEITVIMTTITIVPVVSVSSLPVTIVVIRVLC